MWAQLPKDGSILEQVMHKLFQLARTSPSTMLASIIVRAVAWAGWISRIFKKEIGLGLFSMNWTGWLSSWKISNLEICWWKLSLWTVLPDMVWALQDAQLIRHRIDNEASIVTGGLDTAKEWILLARALVEHLDIRTTDSKYPHWYYVVGCNWYFENENISW